MSETMPDEVSIGDTLRHIVDDHPCCARSLLYVIARIGRLEAERDAWKDAALKQAKALGAARVLDDKEWASMPVFVNAAQALDAAIVQGQATTGYRHDEWCDTNLAVPSECNCYVHLIEERDVRIEALERTGQELLDILGAEMGDVPASLRVAEKLLTFKAILALKGVT